MTASAATVIGANPPGDALCSSQFIWGDTDYVVPAGGGAIVSFSYLSHSAGDRVNFKVLRANGDGTFLVVGESGVQTTQTASSLETFNLSTPITVEGGDFLGFWPVTNLTGCTAWSQLGGPGAGSGRNAFSSSDPAPGQSVSFSPSYSWDNLNVSATIGLANAAPTVDTAASDANGTEGHTLSASGTFVDSDNDPLTLTADNTVGTFTDNGDGTWSWSYPSADDGSGTITVTAGDGDGGTATDSFGYDVNYVWAGFFSPVANKDGNGNYIVNKVTAGASVPVKFSLGGNQGLDIFASGYPKSETTACTSNAVDKNGTDSTSEALSYDPVTQRYSYVWKTIKGWANTCRQLVMKLGDDTYHRANFKFTK